MKSFGICASVPSERLQEYSIAFPNHIVDTIRAAISEFWENNPDKLDKGIYPTIKELESLLVPKRETNQAPANGESYQMEHEPANTTGNQKDIVPLATVNPVAEQEKLQKEVDENSFYSKELDAATSEEIRNVNLTYDAFTRRDRVTYIARMFSKRLTEALESKQKELNQKLKNPAITEGVKARILRKLKNLDRHQMINELTPKGIFNLVKKGFEDYLNNYSFEERVQMELNAINEIPGSEKISDEKKLKASKIRAERKQVEYPKILDNFNALAQEACASISVKELVLIGSVGYMKADTLEEQISNSEDNVYNPDDNSNTISGKEESIKDGWMNNFRTLTSRDSLSKEVAAMLGDIVEVGYNGKIVKDDLQNSRYLDASRVHVALMHQLSNMTSPKDLIPYLERMAKFKPWVKQVINKLKKDEVLMSKFYQDFRKDAISYSVVIKKKSDDGTFVLTNQKVNQLEPVKYLIDEMRSNYETGTLMDDGSIYTKERKINRNNAVGGMNEVAILNNALGGKNDSEVRKIIGEHPEYLDKMLKLVRMLGFDINKEQITAIALPKGNETASEDSKAWSLVYNLTTVYSLLVKEGQGAVTNLITDSKRALDRVAKVFEDVQDSYFENTFREGGKSYSSHVTPSYLGKIVKELKMIHGNRARFDKFINDNFKKYKWFFKDGQWLNSIIEGLATDSTIRENLEWKVELNFDRAEYTDWDSVDYMNVILSNYFAEDNTNYAYYYVPILSDAPSAEFLRLEKITDGYDFDPVSRETLTYKQAIVRRMSNLVNQEYDRIIAVTKRRRLIAEGKINPIKYYDISYKNGKKIPGGSEFKFIPELNEYRTEDGKSFIRKFMEIKKYGTPKQLREFTYQVLNSIMDEKYAKAFQTWETNGLLDKTDRGLFKNLPTDKFQQGNIESAKKMLEEFFWNNTYMQSQIIQLTAGDLAFYKNMEDFQKRYKEFHSPALKINTEATYNGEEVFHLKNERVMYLKDEEIVSFSQKNIDELLAEKVTKKELDKTGMEIISTMYKRVNVTDAQAYRSLKSYRKVMIGAGKWSDKAEIAYNHLTNPSQYGQWTTEDFFVIWQTIKPYMFSMVGVDSHVEDYGPIKVGVQHKNSEFLLLAMYDAIMSPLNTSPKLRALNEFMEKHDIDVVMFNSAVKTGEQGAFELPELGNKDRIVKYLESQIVDENGNENPEVVHEFPYDDWGVQMETPEHIVDKTQLIGTQLRKLIPADFPNVAEIEIEIALGKKVKKTKEEWLQLYSDLVTANIMEQFEELDKIFNAKDKNGRLTKKEVEKLLLDEARSNPRYGQEIVNACRLRPDGNFNIPLYEPIQSQRVQSLINSIIRSMVTKQKIKGGSCFQVSCYGLSESLQIQWENTKEGKRIKYMDCYMPAYSKEFFEPLMDKDGNLNVEDLPEELRRLVGYRVPTEDKYSMLPLRIKGFLPQQNGSAIMLPADITTITGSDFDIDKLYIMLPEFRIIEYNMRKAREDYAKENVLFNQVISQFTNSQLAESILEADTESFKEWFKRNEDKYRLSKPIMSKIRYDFSKPPKENSVGARNNLFLDMVTSILTHPDTALKIMKPGGFEELKRIDRLINVLTRIPKHFIEEFCKSHGMGYDLFANLSAREYEALLEEYGTVTDPLSVNTQLEFHRKNTIGGEMIGVYANHNANHAIVQYTNMYIKDKFAFTFNNKTLKSLHRVKNSNGNYISRNIAIWLAASVDNVKDNTLDSTNQNYFTGDIAMLLTRLGYQHTEVAVLMNQPIVKWLTREYFRNKDAVKGKTKTDFINERLKSVGHSISIDYDSILTESFNLRDLVSYILNDDKSANPKFDSYQMKVGILFMKMMECADALGDVVRNSRPDVVRMAAGPTIADTLVRILRLRKLERKSESKKFPIANPMITVPNGTPEGILGYMQAFYKYGIEDTEKLLKNYFPHYNQGFISVIEDISDEVTSGTLTVNEMNDVINNLFAYILSGTEFFGNDTNMDSLKKREYYINQFPKDFLYIRIHNSEIGNNRFVKALSLREKSKYCNIPHLVLNNVGSLSQANKENLTNDWTALLYSKSPEANKLAKDLFLYCYYRTGFAFSPDTFMHLASNELKTQIPGYIETLDGLINNDDRYADFIDQYIRNHYYNNKLVPVVKQTDLQRDLEALGTQFNIEGFSIDISNKNLITHSKFFNRREQEYNIPKRFVLVDIPDGPILYKCDLNLGGLGDFYTYIPSTTLGRRNAFLEYNRNDNDLKSAISSVNDNLSDTIGESDEVSQSDPYAEGYDDSVINYNPVNEETATNQKQKAIEDAASAVFNKKVNIEENSTSLKDVKADENRLDESGKPMCK